MYINSTFQDNKANYCLFSAATYDNEVFGTEATKSCQFKWLLNNESGVQLQNKKQRQLFSFMQSCCLIA